MAVTASLGGALALDRITRRNLISYADSRAARTLQTYGDYTQFSGPLLSGVFLLHGWTAEDPQSMTVSWDLIESFGYASAISEALKFSLGRRRPYQTDDPFEFRPGSTSGSFPSGHTTAAFAAAATLAENYPVWQVAVPAYGAAAAVGFSRLYANKHWGSDVLGGAFVGTGLSYELHRRHTHHDQAWDLEPSPNGGMVVWRF